ncbi:hypothetical protein C7S17_2059 [Burkholderia thailandensis]|nr:hypothetical protein [Burkholderia thailandensis]
MFMRSRDAQYDRRVAIGRYALSPARRRSSAIDPLLDDERTLPLIQQASSGAD